jgi:hypothetical protein
MLAGGGEHRVEMGSLLVARNRRTCGMVQRASSAAWSSVVTGHRTSRSVART